LVADQRGEKRAGRVVVGGRLEIAVDDQCVPGETTDQRFKSGAQHGQMCSIGKRCRHREFSHMRT